VTDLYTESYGTGDPVLLIHGSGSWGVDTFGAQRTLADEFRLIIMDRRGYGQSPPAESMGWQTDKDDVAHLLTELGSAHVVGHSTGGTVALIAAAMVPHAVRSLVVVEPTVWGIADPAVSPPERPAAYQEAWTRGQRLSAKEFMIVTTEAAGVKDAAAMISQSWASASEADWAAAEAMRRASWAGSAPIDVAALAAAGFAKVVVVGAWDLDLHPDLADMWASGWRQAVAAEHCSLAQAVSGRLVTMSRSAHGPMIEEADTFNALLRDTWRAASWALSGGVYFLTMFVSGLVNLYTRDIEIGLHFYRDLLGLAETFRTPAEGTPEHVELELNGFTVGLGTVEAARRVHDIEAAPGSPAMVLVVWTDDVDRACESLAAAGVPVLQPPHNTGNNNRNALLRDPDGNLVEIVSKVS